MRTAKNIIISFLAVLSFGITTAFADGIEYKAYVVYGENLQFPMPEITANLYNSNGEFVASTVTGTDGIFEFEGLAPGESYSVQFSTDLDPFGVDLADAFLLLKYLTRRASLSDLQLAAADVNGDSKVNFSDFAFIVSQWYLRGEDFPAGDWVLPVWTFNTSALKAAAAEDGPDGPITIVSTSDISSELNPIIKDATFGSNSYKEFSYADSQYELNLPISFVKSQKVFGMGLEMAFNNRDIEITGINSHFDDAEYLIDGNQFKLSWVSEYGESFVANQDFLELKVRFNNLDDAEVILNSIAKAQFVGENGELLNDVQLNMPKFKKLIADISVGNPYPNPGNNEINFAINQSFNENVQVEIYNLSGQLVKQINVTPQSNKITISTSELPNGSYLCSLNLNTNREVKLINVQH